MKIKQMEKMTTKLSKLFSLPADIVKKTNMTKKLSLSGHTHTSKGVSTPPT